MKIRETKNMINREKYKEIKKYDHRQLEEFLRALYLKAFNDGKEAAAKQGDQGIETLINALNSGDCKGVKGATATKIREFALEKGLIRCE